MKINIFILSLFVVLFSVFLSGEALASKTRSADGKGQTAHIDFIFRVHELNKEDNIQGFVNIKPLSSDDEIRKIKVKVESVFWTDKTAFMKGPAEVSYNSGIIEDDYEVKILAVDEDYLAPDPVPYYDVFAVLLCQEDTCTIPWQPWIVESGNIVVEQ